MHPPAGATALFLALAPDNVAQMGLSFAVAPVFVGSIVHVLTALVWNNLAAMSDRTYPLYWRFWKNMVPNNSSTKKKTSIVKPNPLHPVEECISATRASIV